MEVGRDKTRCEETHLVYIEESGGMVIPVLCAFIAPKSLNTSVPLLQATRHGTQIALSSAHTRTERPFQEGIQRLVVYTLREITQPRADRVAILYRTKEERMARLWNMVQKTPLPLADQIKEEIVQVADRMTTPMTTVVGDIQGCWIPTILWAQVLDEAFKRRRK